jgi:ribosome assembly protein YihI (activator of Der GTPase)
MKTTSVEIRARLGQRLERYAAEEDLSLEELVDHVLRAYAEQFGLGLDDDDQPEDE